MELAAEDGIHSRVALLLEALQQHLTLSRWDIHVVHVLMRDEKEGSSKQGQTNKAKQHSTPKVVTFPKKNELPRVGHVHLHAYTHVHVYIRCTIPQKNLNVKTIALISVLQKFHWINFHGFHIPSDYTAEISVCSTVPAV